MKIKQSFTGVSAVSDVQVQKAISHLLIKKTGAAAITNETISIVLQSGGTQHAIATKVKIRDIGVISQFENGYIHQTVSGADIITEILLEITGLKAALQVQDNDYLAFDLANLTVGSSYEIYGLENPSLSRVFINYNTTVISGVESQTKAYSLKPSHKSLCIRNNAALSKVRLFTHDGGEVSYLPTELSALARELNSITQMADLTVEGDAINQTIAGGASEFFYLPTQDFKAFEITTEGGTDLTFVLTELRSF